jgi:hypothetical protein
MAIPIANRRHACAQHQHGVRRARLMKTLAVRKTADLVLIADGMGS